MVGETDNTAALFDSTDKDSRGFLFQSFVNYFKGTKVRQSSDYQELDFLQQKVQLFKVDI